MGAISSVGVEGNGSELADEVRVQSSPGEARYSDPTNVDETISVDPKSASRAAVGGEQGRSMLEASDSVGDTGA